MNDEHAAYYAETPWTWRDRLRFKLFPSQPCPLPAAPAGYEDCLFINTVVVLSWVDRVRVLLTGCVRVETRTVTEYRVGGSMTASVAYPILAPESRR